MIRSWVAGVYLALRERGVKVEFQDYLDNASGFDTGLSSGKAVYGSGVDTYCVAMFLSNKRNALRLLREIRQREPQAQVIVFGPFASVFFRQILEKGLADIVVRMDPEFALPALLTSGWDKKQLAVIPNLAYLHSKKVIITADNLLNDLDQLPFVGPYLYEQGQRPVNITTARGCPFKCSFCDRHCLWGERVRMRSVDNVAAEVEILVSRYGLKDLFFCDSTFIINKQRTIRLCKQLRKLSRLPRWECSTRVDTVNEDLLRVMKWAGCSRIYFGVESGSPTVLRKLGKRYGRRDILNAVRWARNAGLGIGIFMTVGNPGETTASIRSTKRLLADLGPAVDLLINPLVVLPGTKLYYDLLKKKGLSEEDFFDSDRLMYYNFDVELYQKEFSAFRKNFEVFPTRTDDPD
jgi:radical SAM superfamily enzyme YgiQ (UPF0313 family)